MTNAGVLLLITLINADSIFSTFYRRLTIILDRPESIREEDIDTPLPEPDLALDQAQSEDNLANLQASISLTRLFNEVVQ